MRFNIRDILWAMVVVGLAIALYKEREHHRQTLVAACNLEAAFECLTICVLESENWVIEASNGHLGIHFPDKETRPSRGVWWTYPRHPLYPPRRFERTWSRSTLTERDFHLSEAVISSSNLDP